MYPLVPHNNLNVNNLSIDIIEDLTRMVTDELIDELGRIDNESESILQPATSEQIASLEKLNNNDKDDIFCAICQDKIKIGETYSSMPCKTHLYHSQCIEEWLQRDNSCPICRVPIELKNDNDSVMNNIFITVIFPDGSILYKSFKKNTTVRNFFNIINNHLNMDLSQKKIIIKNLVNNEKLDYDEILNSTISNINIQNDTQIKIIKI